MEIADMGTPLIAYRETVDSPVTLGPVCPKCGKTCKVPGRDYWHCYCGGKVERVKEDEADGEQGDNPGHREEYDEGGEWR